MSKMQNSTKKAWKARSNLFLNKNSEHSFWISPGSVRGFLIIWLVCILMIYIFIIGINEPPIHFIIAFNIVLAYYGIKPKEMLPTPLQAEVPIDYGKLKRIKPLDEFLEKTNDFLDEVKNEVTDIIVNLREDFNEYEDYAKKSLKDLQEEMDNFLKYVKKLSVKGKTIIEQIGLLILLVVIGIFSIWYIETFNEPFDAITISLAAFLSAISIAFGHNLQDIMAKYVQPHLRNSKLVIEQSFLKINSLLDKAEEITGSAVIEIENRINNIREANVLIYFPKDIVAMFTMLIMIFFCGFIFLFPEVAFNEIFLLILEFIIGYYFLTKK